MHIQKTKMPPRKLRAPLTAIHLLLVLVGPSGCDQFPSSSTTMHEQTSSSPVSFSQNVVRLTTRSSLLALGGAIKAVGRQKLARVASKTALGINVTTFASILNTDKDLVLDVADERLLQVCTGLASAAQAIAQRHDRQQHKQTATAVEASTSAVGAAQQQTAGLTLREVFSLSSRPGAAKKLLLDFDGHTVKGTDWNYPGYETFVMPPWDTDRNASSFSQDELAQIKTMWKKVAEDFAPFDVDVTTSDPGEAALLGTGQRAIIGGSNNILPMFAGAGGSCWVGSFGTKNPCLIFQKPLYSDVKVVANAISHELGHGLGLLHDGTDREHGNYEYFRGFGDVWGPIMGLPYYANITQWDRGEYLGSNNNQDDVAVMGQRIGVLPSQHGSSFATASLLPANGVVSGLISNPGQSDFFCFSALQGPLTIDATGAGVLVNAPGEAYPMSNLDLQIMLYTTAGTVIKAANPQGASVQALEASMQFTLQSSGIYYISVSGSGAGDSKFNGYSAYGSLGQYSLRVSYTNGPQPSPKQSLSPPPFPSPLPSPELFLSPSPVPSVPVQSPDVLWTPSPSPVSKPSPSPLPEGTAGLSLLTAWPLYSPITTADVTAGKVYSTTDFCTKISAPVLGMNGVTVLAAGTGKCNVESSGVVSDGPWFLSSLAASPAELDRWECYNVTEGDPAGPFIIMGPTGAGINLQSGCMYTCVAVYTVPGYNYEQQSPSPTPVLDVSSSPAPESNDTAVLALISSFPIGHVGPRADLSANRFSNTSSCIKAPAPRLGESNITVVTPGPGTCSSGMPAGVYELYAEAPPDTILDHWECWNVTYTTTYEHFRDSCTTVTSTAPGGAAVIQTNCTNSSSKNGGEQPMLTAALLASNASAVSLYPNWTVTCVAMFNTTQQQYNKSPSNSPLPGISPFPLLSPLPSPIPYPPTMNISVKYMVIADSSTGGTFYGLFTVTAIDIWNKKRISGVAFNATISISLDDMSTDPQNKYPYSLIALLPRSGRKMFRTYKVRTKAARKRNIGTSIVFHITGVQHSVYVTARSQPLIFNTPEL